MRRRRPGSNPKQGGLAPLLVAAIPVAAILVAAIAGAQPNSAIATPTRVPASRPSNRATTKKSPPRASKRAAPRSIDLDEIVVTGTQETNKDDATTLHRKKLEPHDAQSVADVLARDPAIYVSTGRSGVHSLTLRGFDQRQTTLLIDGVPAYVPYDGLLNLDLLPVEILDHITLVKRSGSQLHSPNSMGGTINLVTRAPGAGPLVELLTDYGSANALNLGASHALRLGPVSYTLYGGWRRRDAFPLAASFTPTPRENGVLRENSDSAIFHAGGTFRVRISDRHVLRASALLVDGARGIPPGLDEPVVRYWRFSTWRALNVSAGHRGRYLGGSLEVDEVAFFRGFDNLVDSFDDDTYQTQTSARAFHSGHHDQLAGGRARAHLHLAKTPWGPTDLRLWLSGQVDRHEEDAPPPGNNTLMRGLVSIIPEAEAFFGERWSATTAAQLDIEIPGTTPGGNAASRLGFGFWVSGHFDPSDNLSLRGTVARRHRFPTLKERFTSAQGRRIPNPDLTPEKAWRFSLDATWCPLRAISFRGGLHDAEVSDLIVLTPQGGGREQLRNISSARLLGADVEVSYRWRRWIDAHAAYAFLYARQDRVLTGDDRLPYRPAHQATFVFRSTPLTWLALQTTLRVTSERPYEHPASSAWETLSTYATWDARVNVKVSSFATLHVQARNLLDTAYASKAGYPEPGRTFWIGLRLRYDRPIATPSPRRAPSRP